LNTYTTDASGTKQFVSADVAECLEVVVASELQNGALYAIPIGDNGTAANPPLEGNTPAVVVFEPVTSTALTLFGSSPHTIAAYELGGTKLAPTLAKVDEWVLADFDPDIVVARVGL